MHPDLDHGTRLGCNEDLPGVLTALDELRLRPLALAQFLLSVEDEALGRVGRILSEPNGVLDLRRRKWLRESGFPVGRRQLTPSGSKSRTGSS